VSCACSALNTLWARRPLAAARAVIFCQMVDDPSAVPEEFPTDESYEHERLRLFALISELVNWENTTTAATMTKTPHHLHRLGEVGLGDGRAPGRQVSG